MKRNEIKTKSYNYLLQNILILLAIVSAIFFAVGLLISERNDYRIIIFIAIMIPIILFWVICALITRLGCRTYDIYTESGIKRVKGNKVIFETTWDNVKSSVYFNFAEIVILSPFVLNIDLIQPLNFNDNRSYDNSTSISTPMKPKVVKLIAELMTIEIKNAPKSN